MGADRTTVSRSKQNDRNAIKVLDKAIAVLRSFSPQEPYLSAQEISQRLGLNKTTVHRILSALEQSRMVYKDDRSHRYSLGIGTRELAWSDLWRNELKALAVGPMRELRDQTRETVCLYTMCSPIEFEAVLFLDSPLMIRPFERIGQPALLGRGATSRMFLAFELERSGRDGLTRLLRALPEKRLPMPIDQIIAEVERASAQGSASIAGERFPDAASVAAPIRDSRGNGLAVLTLFGPSERLDAQRRSQLTPHVKATAQRISEQVSLVTGPTP